jgi:hypothetical protein
MSTRVIEARVVIATENSKTEYTLLIPIEQLEHPDPEERIHKVLGSGVVLGTSLLDGQWTAEGLYRVSPQTEDEHE